MTEVKHTDVEWLWITTGVPGDDQESSFMNATLQQAGDKWSIEFSVACHIGIPAGPAEHDEDALADYLRDVLERVHIVAPELNWEIQIGPEGGRDTDG